MVLLLSHRTQSQTWTWFLCPCLTLMIWLGQADSGRSAAATPALLVAEEYGHDGDGVRGVSTAAGRHMSDDTAAEERANANVGMLTDERHLYGQDIEINSHKKEAKEHTVAVTNDGPVLLGSIATFVATVSTDPSILKDANKNRVFVWTGPPKYLPQIMFSADTCTIEIPLDMSLKPGEMTITVTVHEGELGPLVGVSNSSIKVTDTINGKISLSSSAYPQCNVSNPSCSIPTKTNLTIEADLYDPSYFLEDALLFYKWNMGNGVTMRTTSPELVYSFPSKGDYNITANITALKDKGGELRRINGSWWRTIKVLDAITNLTIASRSSSVQVGNRESVNITCNGSLPVELCLTVDEPSSEWSNQTNTTCEMVVGDVCRTTFTYIFHSLGEYTFQAAATNNVSFAVNVSTIHAHAPALPPQSLTAITVAVIAGLCMTSFALISFIQHVRRSRERHVEVANFDFQFREHTNSFVRTRKGLLTWTRSPSENSSLKTKSRYNFYS
ncbi:transmembrane protein 130-like isoform X2 [Lytechinus variegatus]|uniref:transmembrane protein 130-like isoform X2 n=1 Tax=Lytechinus variegatus TaxID=7654 RepID=UPI001BB2062E|nr:transmembrane protein 130-like isoform X2 [Lytechinus variegatus]